MPAYSAAALLEKSSDVWGVVMTAQEYDPHYWCLVCEKMVVPFRLDDHLDEDPYCPKCDNYLSDCWSVAAHQRDYELFLREGCIEKHE